MQYMGVNEIREKFLKFFEEKEHLRLPSSSLVPKNDKSLLLINSGMAPLKPYFTGQETPPNKRVATCQKCIRTGDIENVGKTARHGTFFEMLGNFSFGDYFKNEIIPWSWEFVTEVLQIPKEKLYVTVYQDDDEAYKIWNEKVGIPKEKIFHMGKEDNFWEHGLGPCGPCSEIYFDRGEAYGCEQEGCTVGCDCDRYMEFWNLVFTQFDKQENGAYLNLTHPNIDTGMGLERMGTIMQGVDSIFDVDTIRAIIKKGCELAHVEYRKDHKTDVSIRVITDHIRSVTFMTADGVLPSNEGRGYVLRRLLRRAARHGRLLGIQTAFLADLCKSVIEVSGEAYPELIEKKDYILKILCIEENSFYKTIDKGMEILKSAIREMKDSNQKIMDGALSFRLYDTYGFPIDLTKEILEEEGLDLEEEAFEKEMKLQKERARTARAQTNYMGADETVYDKLDIDIKTNFVGYEKNKVTDAKILALISKNKISESASAGDEVSIFLDKTAFYAQSGGQAGDHGKLQTETGIVEITDCIKVVGKKIAHIGIVTDGSILVGDIVTSEIEVPMRMASARNHSATHLLQKALRTVLGNHVEQAGSFVSAERLRFDFTHFSSLTEEELKKVEKIVNEKILESNSVQIEETSMEQARQKGAMALFGEKYGETVRVVSIGDSVELCGGTHVLNTSQIGSFKIVSENGIASGVRRIEALTGTEALKHYQQQEQLLQKICISIKTNPENILKKVEQILAEQKELSKQIQKLNDKMAGSVVEEILDKKVEVNGICAVFAQVKHTDANTLRTIGDQIKDKLKSGVIVLASDEDEKVNFVVMATDDVVKKGAHAGNIIKSAATVCGGGGGGRPNMAQAGGKDSSKIKESLEKAKEVLKEQIK